MSLLGDIVKCVGKCVCICLKAEGNRRKWRCTMNSIRKLCGWAMQDEETPENNGQAAQAQEIPPHAMQGNNANGSAGNNGLASGYPAAGYEVAWWQDPIPHQQGEHPSRANALVFSGRNSAAEEQPSSSALEISIRP